MKTTDFFFELPEHLIAQHPAERRGESRLMVVDRITGKQKHSMVNNLPEILSGNEFLGKDGGQPLLVFNNSRVRKARLFGTSEQTGAKTEFLLLEKIENGPGALREQGVRPTGCDAPPSDLPQPLIWKALVKRAGRHKVGNVYAFYGPDGAEAAKATITGEEGEFRFLQFDRLVDDGWLDQNGHIPLPPYIKREDAPQDADRYQTVYAAAAGSVAAPTAGLHFTDELLGRFAAAGIETAFITLHVGLGTFLPVRSENIEEHVMHEETFYINEEAAAKIEKAKAEGRKIIAVGTTCVRTLESAWDSDRLKRGEMATSIFIYPGYQFKIVDALFTNFHTPESTLVMLVSAFADKNETGKIGRDLILESYAEAVRESYRFFSYGDAMIIV